MWIYISPNREVRNTKKKKKKIHFKNFKTSATVTFFGCFYVPSSMFSMAILNHIWFAIVLHTATVAFVGATSFCNHTLNVEIQFDQYPSEIGWYLIDENGTLILDDDGTQFSAFEIYNQSDVCISSGCFDFFIFDSYGNGMFDFISTSGWFSLTLDDEITFGKQSFHGEAASMFFCTEMFAADEENTGAELEISF